MSVSNEENINNACKSLHTTNGNPRIGSRYETPISTVHSNINKFGIQQINLRRKAEILEYKDKLNAKTKNQRYAEAACGATRFRRASFASQNSVGSNSNTQNLATNGDTLVCTVNNQNVFESTNSNVPGRPMMLVYNLSTPLYNYNVRRNYA